MIVEKEIVSLVRVVRDGGYPTNTLAMHVGGAWARYWRGIEGDAQYGARYREPAPINQFAVWVYPEAARSEFQRWLACQYVSTDLIKYLRTPAVSAESTEAAAWVTSLVSKINAKLAAKRAEVQP